MINYMQFITNSLAIFAQSDLFKFLIIPIFALTLLILFIGIIKMLVKGEI